MLTVYMSLSLNDAIIPQGRMVSGVGWAQQGPSTETMGILFPAFIYIYIRLFDNTAQLNLLWSCYDKERQQTRFNLCQ